MPIHQPLVFEPKRLALLNTMVEHAYDEATERGLFLSANPQEARLILVRRMIGAIDAGETDPETLQALALRDDTRPITGADLFWARFH